MKGQTEIIGLVVVVILLVVIVLIFLSISSTKEDVIREDIVTDSTLKVVMRYSVPECNGLEISRLIANPGLCGINRGESYIRLRNNYILKQIFRIPAFIANKLKIGDSFIIYLKPIQ